MGQAVNNHWRWDRQYVENNQSMMREIPDERRYQNEVNLHNEVVSRTHEKGKKKLVSGDAGNGLPACIT